MHYSMAMLTDSPPTTDLIDSLYYPVALVGTWPLGALPTDDEFMAKVDPFEDWEE